MAVQRRWFVPEIERKWRILNGFQNDFFISKVQVTGPNTEEIEQFYVVARPGEVRLRRKGDKFFLTIKGDGSLTREEHETEVPDWVFSQLRSAALGLVISKTRVTVVEDNITYEVDVYSGRFHSLIVVEVEFPSEEAARAFTLPDWILAADPLEVTEDRRYKNKSLAMNGFPLLPL